MFQSPDYKMTTVSGIITACLLFLTKRFVSKLVKNSTSYDEFTGFIAKNRSHFEKLATDSVNCTT